MAHDNATRTDESSCFPNTLHPRPGPPTTAEFPRSFPMVTTGYGTQMTTPGPDPSEPDPSPVASDSATSPRDPRDSVSDEGRATRDRELDEELDESFPTSDPPSTWSGPDRG